MRQRNSAKKEGNILIISNKQNFKVRITKQDIRTIAHKQLLITVHRPLDRSGLLAGFQGEKEEAKKCIETKGKSMSIESEINLPITIICEIFGVLIF